MHNPGPDYEDEQGPESGYITPDQGGSECEFPVHAPLNYHPAHTNHIPNHTHMHTHTRSHSQGQVLNNTTTHIHSHTHGVTTQSGYMPMSKIQAQGQHRMPQQHMPHGTQHAQHGTQHMQHGTQHAQHGTQHMQHSGQQHIHNQQKVNMNQAVPPPPYNQLTR
jgi:hypothetical protein